MTKKDDKSLKTKLSPSKSKPTKDNKELEFVSLKGNKVALKKNHSTSMQCVFSIAMIFRQLKKCNQSD